MSGDTLRLVLDTGTARRAVEVTVGADDVTVADVLEAAGCASLAAVGVDGRRVPTDRPLAAAGIVDGSTVVCAAPAPTVPAADVVVPSPRLAVVAGAGAGASVPLDGPIVVGRDPACDLVVPSRTVSRRHCRVEVVGGEVVVVDLATTNGTWVDGRPVGRAAATVAVGGVLRIGAVVLRVAAAPADDRPRGVVPDGHDRRWRVPFNRPPRPGPPPVVAPVDVPRPGSAPPAVQPFPVAAVVAPVVLGAAMVVVLGSWRYAAFLALSPLLVLAGTVAGRLRARRLERTTTREEQAAAATFAASLAAAAVAARQRRWELLPPVDEVVRRARQPSTRLWERRPDHDDALRLHVGVGAVQWQPPLEVERGQAPLGAARAVVERWSRLPDSPVAVELAGGGVVGVVGDRPGAVALARSLLLQACVHHGPADLAVAVATGHATDWDWAVWLPHTATGSGRRLVAAGAAAGRALLAALRDRDPVGSASGLLVVVDDEELLRGRDAVVRDVLRGRGGSAAGIVVASSLDQLPAVCDTVVEVTDPEGGARVVRPRQRSVVDGVAVAGLDVATCAAAARRLAGLEDPEVAATTSALPRRVDLLDLLPDRLDVAAAWDRGHGQHGLCAPIGVGADGPVTVDLVATGPHALLGGTTGAGKSELLRTLVAALAATHDPDHCTFVLVDYKGGAAFDACADLPHVVGVVTDLDEHLGERALRCLEAELVHREQRLRAAGVSDIPTWLRLPTAGRGAPLPRLVVVVDEFATLRAELPDFVDALVGIAQRGRSLGVHLVLGTQRPSGAVDDNVRANVNVRIALRMTDDRDSVDVVGVADAAAIPPSVPGRGLLRTGPQRPVPVQTALVTGVASAAGPRVRVAALRFAGGRGSSAEAVGASGPTDLDRLVAACTEEFAARGLCPPRTPWPPPLPSVLGLDDVVDAPDVPVPYGLLDDPDRQRQVPVGWDPARGSLLVHGAVGSGTTTTLATVAVAAARRHDADALHLHVLDLGRGELAPLSALPHCGAFVTASEHERRTRLQALLVAEAERRRGLTAEALRAAPLHVLVVDGLDAWLAALDDPGTHAAFEAVQRLLVEAPRLRMAVVGSVGRPGVVRHAVVAATEQRLAHRLADPTDHAVLGLHPGRVPELVPGRAVRPDGAVVQVARVDDLTASVAALADATPTPRRPPAEVGTLPGVLPWPRGRDRVVVGRDAWQLPVGVDAVALRPAVWVLHPGDHAVVLGPPGAGRSGLLQALAALAAPTVAVDVVAASHGSWPPGARCHPHDGLARVLAAAEARTAPTLVLVDDAERVPDPGPALAASSAPGARVHVVAAARQDVVVADYGHWLRRAARARIGLFLQPTGDVPGDLLGVRLPRRPPMAVRPGRGWFAAAGAATFVQAFGPAS